jgi:hypothetical protein
VSAAVEYEGRVWYDPPVLPEISASCGVGGTRPRARVAITTNVELTNRWTLRPRTRVLAAPLSDESRDRCKATALSIDVTDRALGAAKEAIRPKLAQFEVRGDTLVTTVGLSVNPRIVGGPRPAPSDRPMPPPADSASRPPVLHLITEGRMPKASAHSRYPLRFSGLIAGRPGKDVHSPRKPPDDRTLGGPAYPAVIPSCVALSSPAFRTVTAAGRSIAPFRSPKASRGSSQVHRSPTNYEE